MKTHLEIIQHYIDLIGAKSYLEIGLGTGANFDSVKCEYKVGVDPASALRMTEGSEVIPVKSDDFFCLEGWDRAYDVIFLDGDHTAEQLERDIVNAVKWVSEGGVILVHDINPPSEVSTLIPRETKEWCGTCYKAWYGFVDMHPCIKTEFYPQDYGIGVIHHSGWPVIPCFASDISYDQYKKWLNESVLLHGAD